MDPPKRLQHLVDPDAEGSETPTFLTPTDWRAQIDSLNATVDSLNLRLNEEERKNEKLSSEYKDLVRHHDSEMKKHLDQIRTLEENHTRLLMKMDPMESKIVKMISLVKQMEEALRENNN